MAGRMVARLREAVASRAAAKARPRSQRGQTPGYRKEGDPVTRSRRHRKGAKGRREVAGTREHGEGKEKATEVMTAVRLAITLWELIWTIVRDHASGGGSGRVL
jgi:hypothetical protein